MRRSTLPGLAIAASLCLPDPASASAVEPLSPGKPFPVIALPDIQSGEARSIVDFRGQKLMLHLFASW